ncbi:MAG TPA: GAF domain-containing protein, partial [Chloroflexi bacterium]|nr:GAF domain-containing protein [Chloroflexota bacterium]
MSDLLRIVLVDDNPDDRALTLRALGQVFPDLQVEQITNAEQFTRAVEAGGFDLVITDYQLHWTTGLDILRVVKDRWPNRSVVMFTGTGNEEIAVEAMKADLDDYILKSPKHFARLPAAVRLALERARQRQALVEAETRYQSLFERVPVGLYRTTPQGQIVEANPALVQMLGYPDRRSLLAANAADFYVDSEDRRREQALLEREGLVRDFEVRIRRRDGTVIWVLDNVRAVRDAAGRVVCYEGSLEDITERRRAEEETRQRAAQSEALNAIIAAAAAARDLPRLLETALDRTLRALGLEKGSIWVAGRHIIRGLPPGIGPASMQVIQAAKPHISDAIVVEDWQQVAVGDALSAVEPLMARFGVRASLTVPILAERERIGGLNLVSLIPRSWPPRETALVEAVGRQLGTAAERLRLFQAERGQRELAEALEAAAAAVSSTLEPDEVLDRILEQVERVVAGDAFNVMLVEDGKARVVRWWGYERLGTEERVAGSAIPVTEYPNLLRMVQRGEPVVVPDTAADRDWVLVGGREWLRSYVGAPIRVRGLTVGFLNVDSAQPGRFGPADGRRLQAFADHAAIAIENAQLYRELRGHAERLEERVREQTAAIQAQYAR